MYLTLCGGGLNQVASEIHERLKATFSSSPPGAPLPILPVMLHHLVPGKKHECDCSQSTRRGPKHFLSYIMEWQQTK